MKNGLFLAGAFTVAIACAAVGYYLGFEAGGRKVMLVDARVDLLADIDVSRRLHESGIESGLTAMDSKINSAVVEVAQLTDDGSEEETSARANVFRKLAEHRSRHPDKYAGTDPSGTAERVKRIVSELTDSSQ
jgi:hypothetical protein